MAKHRVKVVLPSPAAGDVPAGEWYFKLVWNMLAEAGVCDAWNAAECRRVFREWVAAGRPNGLRAFIREAANRPPTV